MNRSYSYGYSIGSYKQEVLGLFPLPCIYYITERFKWPLIFIAISLRGIAKYDKDLKIGYYEIENSNMTNYRSN